MFSFTNRTQSSFFEDSLILLNLIIFLQILNALSLSIDIRINLGFFDQNATLCNQNATIDFGSLRSSKYCNQNATLCNQNATIDFVPLEKGENIRRFNRKAHVLASPDIA